MSENNAPTYVTDPSTGESYIPGNGVKIFRDTVTTEKSPLKGAIWHYPQFETVDKAIEVFGADPVIDAVNATVRARLWLKVANKVKPETADPVAIEAHYAALLAADPVIGTIEFAQQFKLGVRDQSPAAIGREMNATLKAIGEAAAKGDVATMGQLNAKFNDLMQKMAAFQAEALKAQQMLEAAA